MKTFFIGMGGDKASKLIDLFMSKGTSAYKEKKTVDKIQTNIEIIDVETSDPISDITIDIDGDQSNVQDSNFNLQIPSGDHQISVKKYGYETLSKDITFGNNFNYDLKIGLVPFITRKSFTILNIWMIIFMLFGPIIWAGLRYAGLLGFPTTLDVNYLNTALMIDIVLIFGAFAGYLIIGQFLKSSIKKKNKSEFTTTVGVFIGSVVSVFLLILLVNYSNINYEQYISSIDIMVITFLVIILGILGMVSLYSFGKFLSTKIKLPAITPIIGAGMGGLFGYSAASYVINKFTDIDLLTTHLGRNISFPFHPIIIALSVIIFGYIISKILDAYLKKESSDFLGGLSAWGVAVATTILLMMIYKISESVIISTFVGMTAVGSFIGLIIVYLISKNLYPDPLFEVKQIKTCSKSCSKGEYKYPGMCVVADTVKNTLKNLVCINNDNQVFIDLNISRWDKDHNKILSAETKRLKRKIKTIFNQIIENCIGYPDTFVIFADLRNNELCTSIPLVLEYLKSEYKLPIYFVCITNPDKMNTKFIKEVGYHVDGIFPVTYNLFEGVVNLGKKCVKVNNETVEEDIWEERTVSEILRRFGPLLEIGDRHSPTGVDTSHVLRLINPLKMGRLCCDDNRLISRNNNDVPNTLDKINWCTIGYTRIDIDRCEDLNLEVEFSNLIIHTFHDLLWEFDTNRKTVRSLFIIRGPGKYLKTHLAKDIVSKLFDGVVTVVSDLVVDDSPYLEIIGLFANIPYILPNRDSEDCSETTTVTEPDEDDNEDWMITIPPIIGPIKVSDDDRWPISRQGYADFCAKYGYTPLIRNIAKKIEQNNKDLDWKKVKVAFEFVRDSITYKSDWKSQGVENFVQSPEETLDLGTGDCEDFAILIGAILINMGLDVNLVFVPNHVYPAAYIPDVPNNYRTYKPSQKTDGTNWSDWIGMEATGNWEFGKLPEGDYKIEEVSKVPRR